MDVCIFTDEMISGTAPLNLYVLHYIAPFASSIISTRTPMSSSYERLAGDTLPARDTGLPQSCLVNPFSCAVGLHCLPRDTIVRVGSPLIVPNQISLPFWSECINSFHSLWHYRQLTAFTWVDHCTQSKHLTEMELIGEESLRSSSPVN